jgi:hypothetical protein
VITYDPALTAGPEGPLNVSVPRRLAFGGVEYVTPKAPLYAEPLYVTLPLLAVTVSGVMNDRSSG